MTCSGRASGWISVDCIVWWRLLKDWTVPVVKQELEIYVFYFTRSSPHTAEVASNVMYEDGGHIEG